MDVASHHEQWICESLVYPPIGKYIPDQSFQISVVLAGIEEKGYLGLTGQLIVDDADLMELFIIKVTAHMNSCWICGWIPLTRRPTRRSGGLASTT